MNKRLIHVILALLIIGTAAACTKKEDPAIAELQAQMQAMQAELDKAKSGNASANDNNSGGNSASKVNAEEGSNDSNSGGNSAFNGTWVDGEEKFFLNNGSLTESLGSVEIIKGTYSTSGNNITMNYLQFNGVYLYAVLEDVARDLGLSPSQWYTQQQLRTVMINSFVSEGMSQVFAEAAYDELFNENLGALFATFTGTLSGNTLTLTIGGEPVKYTKVNSEEGSNDNNSAFNGTWVDGSEKFFLENGSFTLSMGNVGAKKGTYSTSGNNITINFLQVNGAIMGEDAQKYGLSPSQWFTQQQFRTVMINYLVSEGMSQAFAEATFDERLNELVGAFFSTNTGTLSGNTLTITIGGEPVKYTRQ